MYSKCSYDFYAWLQTGKKGLFPNAQNICSHIFLLPSHSSNSYNESGQIQNLKFRKLLKCALKSIMICFL